ncbi:uncharacterized protein BDR25DRAFT_363033 [Lindgomyces ingoldianus]|uniref:Uncharacterized protein n=1 Tax=Lindgomyces ingoldianus TaxID=673940 RepID=A0ACB6Q8C2_9PLEO|nr:uncharacterized protein BDR25DRAFT_363033 [Lindgomyces ingoldianus]KAF2463121.1 hypothetical protein BDR25DRAFT_363033 [Lindgomyces ingoldianus]
MVDWVDGRGVKPCCATDDLLSGPTACVLIAVTGNIHQSAGRRCGLLGREFNAMKSFHRRADRTTTTSPQPPFEYCDIPSMEAHQWKLGYENYPTYDYLACVRQCTLGLALALRPRQGAARVSLGRNLLRPRSPSEWTYPERPGDSEEGLNRRGARDLGTLTGRLYEADHLWCFDGPNELVKAVGGRSGAITCQSDEDSTLVERVERVARRGIWSETLTGNAKRELECLVATAGSKDLTPSLGSDPWWTWIPARSRPGWGDYCMARENGCACRCINIRDRSFGRRAGEMCLRSKQELPRRERYGCASTVEGVYWKTGVEVLLSRHVELYCITSITPLRCLRTIRLGKSLPSEAASNSKSVLNCSFQNIIYADKKLSVYKE